MSYSHIRTDAYVHQPALDAAVNPGDRVYCNAESGRCIKVRVKRLDPPPGAPTFGVFFFAVSGAHCGEDGKAFVRQDGRDGHQIAPAHTLTIANDTPVDIELALDAARLRVCCDTERAVEHEERFAALG